MTPGVPDPGDEVGTDAALDPEAEVGTDIVSTV